MVPTAITRPPASRVAFTASAVAGGTRPGPVAGAADRDAAQVERPDVEVVGQPDDLPDAPPADPITQVLDDARERDGRDRGDGTGERS